MSDTEKSWALKVENLTYGTTQYTNYTAYAQLASDYPYIAVPEEVWTDLSDRLVEAGFVCSSTGAAGGAYCATTQNCDEAAGLVPDLEFMVQGDVISSGVATHEAFAATVTSSFYLF